MIWLLLSFITALAVSSTEAFVKKFFSELNVYEMTAIPIIYCTPLLIITAPFIKIPDLDKMFFIIIIIFIPINSIALILYMKAIKISPLSLSVPYLAFTPAFIIITGYFLLDEIPNKWGMSGILLICIGGYFIHIDPKKWTFFEPLKAIFKETGSWLMLIVSFLFSICAPLGKQAIIHSSPMFFSVIFFTIYNIIFSLLLLLFGKIDIKKIFAKPYHGLLTGTLLYTHIISHGFAVSMIKAAYMISIKRFSIIFSIIYGRLLFKEKAIFIRFIGTFIMVSGAVIISILGK